MAAARADVAEDIAIFMIGSRSTGLALRTASRTPMEPAVLKAISEEST
jgi:hypothetical protein